MSIKTVPETDPNWAQCMCCADKGLVGGPMHGHEYRFCLCPAGARLREIAPNAAREANELRETLAKRCA